jgi:hypothetical protein
MSRELELNAAGHFDEIDATEDLKTRSLPV